METDPWKVMALRLARHLRNTDSLPLMAWGIQGLDLLGETRALDPEAYDRVVKTPAVAREARCLNCGGEMELVPSPDAGQTWWQCKTNGTSHRHLLKEM